MGLSPALSYMTMSNGEALNLKRDVETAFGGDNEQNSKGIRRKKPKASKSEQKSGPESASTPKNKAADLQNARRNIPPQSEPNETDTTLVARRKETESNGLIGQKAGRGAKKTSRKSRRSLEHDWSLSAAEGGRFTDHDPLLVQDDRLDTPSICSYFSYLIDFFSRYMILAVRTQILVYLTATSSQVRSLRIDKHDRITSYISCTSSKSHIFVSTYSGLILKWDWTKGQEIKRWKTSEKLLSISEHSLNEKNASAVTLLLLQETSERERRLSLATFSDSWDEIVDYKIILEGKSLASWVKVLDQGRCLILYADNKVYLGQTTRRQGEVPNEYVWREITVPQNITSMDARAQSLSGSSKKKRLAVDIVVGCLNGSILIYDDILSRLMEKEKNTKEDDVVSRRIHWHRNEVLTVKWSLDGNYIISGGHETVIVISQLDTGHQQFLPHLSAAVQHITVSKSGSAYAVHLADNSVMVLSTSELQPTAYVAGLVLRQRRPNDKRARRVAATLYDIDSTAVSLAVPADYPVKSGVPANATLLQTYDLRVQQQSDRQALARNNITALNVDPSGRPIQEPNVTHVRISHDGKWLATIDEWTPPGDDIKPLYLTDEDSYVNVTEIFLKFWIKNESARSWNLVTKIEISRSARARHVETLLDLKANPQRLEFSSISANSSINIYTPKARHRNGLPVKDQSGSQLFTWTCTYTVEIHLPLKNSLSTMSSLAYSPDGSILALSSNKSPLIHFIDPSTGTLLSYTQPSSHPGQTSHLTFLNHHLITLSKDLRVYNSVSSDLLYAHSLSSSITEVLLAANQLDGTFAVVCLIPAFMFKDKNKARSQIMIFNLKSASPVYKKIVDGSVEVLLPLSRESGYLLINDEAEVVYLRPEGSSRSLVRQADGDVDLARLDAATTTANGVLDDILGRGRALEDGSVDDAREREQEGGVTITHKTNSSLADVFEQSVNLPVRELFEGVVGVLKAGKI